MTLNRSIYMDLIVKKAIKAIHKDFIELICIRRVASHCRLQIASYMTGTPTHRRKHALMCILAPSVKSLVEGKKYPQDTKSVLLVRGRLLIGLLQRQRRLFPHVWDQLLTRVKGGRKRGTLLTKHWKWHKVFQLEAFNCNSHTFCHNLELSGTAWHRNS